MLLQYGLGINQSPKTQSELASDLGMNISTLQNYKLLSEMIPELEDLFDTGIVTKTAALAMIKQLSPDEQLSLINSLDTTKRITQKEVQCYIDEIKQLKENPVVEAPADYNEAIARFIGYDCSKNRSF